MKINKRKQDSVVIVDLDGEIDLSDSPQVNNALASLVDAREMSILLNLEKVSYIDSSGLGILVQMLQKVKDYGGRLKLLKLNPDIKKVFELTRLDSFFEVYDDEGKAVTSFGDKC